MAILNRSTTAKILVDDASNRIVTEAKALREMGIFRRVKR